jgi:hypothetical protein
VGEWETVGKCCEVVTESLTTGRFPRSFCQDCSVTRADSNIIQTTLVSFALLHESVSRGLREEAAN